MLLPYFEKEGLEAGCDEAGRGCLAGPVFAAAVILPQDYRHALLNDSKQLSARQRIQARILVETHAIAWGVARVESDEIDRINILKASFLAMHRALEQLGIQPDRLLIDGNRFVPYQQLPFHCMVKGDARFASIAAASILAKTWRDDYMMQLAAEYPHYRWQENKGYPTKVHRKAIAEHGVCIHHRRSFRLLPEGSQGELFPL